MKKVWEKPKLVVLVRGQPEEAILIGCKGAQNPGANQTDGQCMALPSGACGARGEMTGVGNALVCMLCSSSVDS